MEGPKRKKFRTDAAMRHNVDLIEDSSLREDPYGWKASYNQRASVRILTTAAANKLHLRDIQCIRFIDILDPQSDKLHTFFTDVAVTLESFYRHLETEDEFKDFGYVTLNNTDWDSVFSYLNSHGFVYSRENGGSFVTRPSPESRELYGRLSGAQRMFLSAFEVALKTNMMDGPGKAYMTELIHALRVTGNISRVDLATSEPAYHCSTNTTLEVFRGRVDEAYTRLVLQELPPCEPSISSSLKAPEEPEDPRDTQEKRCKIVPDFCIMLPEYPGIFPLVVALQPANGENKGFEQNILQMLSKMVFQDVAFGLVMTPTIYCLVLITKTDDQIRVNRTVPIPLVEFKDGEYLLDINSFKALCTFVYQVIMWSMRTKCSLKTLTLP